MKNLFYLFLLISFIACSKKETLNNVYTINGNLTGLSTDSVFFENPATNQLTASKVENGKFHYWQIKRNKSYLIIHKQPEALTHGLFR